MLPHLHIKPIGLILICLTSITCVLFAQSTGTEFGKVSMEELQMKRYDKDTNAEAVVLYDIGESHFLISDYGSDLYYERKMKIKIFSKAGLKWAQLAIPYYHQSTKVE